MHVSPVGPPLAPPPPPAPLAPPVAVSGPPAPRTPRTMTYAPAHIEPESWFWIRALRDFAPVTAGVGLAAGALVGLTLGAPALGAAWGACVLTGVPGVAIAVAHAGHTIGHLLRGEDLGPRPWDGLRFVGGVLLPTAAVALGTTLAVGTSVAAFGGLLGAGALALAGHLFINPRTRGAI